MRLKDRQRTLLRYLREQDRFCTARELSSALACSVKTVYNDIAMLQQELQQNGWGMLHSKPNCGTRLVLSAQGAQALAQCALTEADCSPPQGEPLFPALVRCLLRQGTVSAEELGQQFHASRSLMERQLDEAQKWLAQMGLVLVRKRGTGHRVEGPGIAFRLAEWALFYQNFPTAPTRYADISQAVRLHLEGFEAAGVVQALQGAEHDLGITWAYDSYTRLVFWGCLTVWCERRGCYEMEPKAPSPLSDLEQKSADLLAGALQRNYHCRLSSAGRAFLELGIAVSEVVRFAGEAQQLHFFGQHPALCAFVSHSVEMMSCVLQMDFSGDSLLEKQLFWAMRSITVFGALGLPDLQGWPLPPAAHRAGSAGTGAAVALLDSLCEQQYQISLTRQESRYLAAILLAAVKRNRALCRVALICAHGVGVAQILREEIEHSIPHVHVEMVLSVRELDSLKPGSCDLAVTVVPLPYVPQGVEVLTMDMQHFDLEPLRRKVEELRCLRGGPVLFDGGGASCLFFPQAVLLDRAEQEKKPLLEKLTSLLREMDAVEPDYLASVLEREARASTLVGPILALPHGRASLVRRSTVALAVLRHPLSWDASHKVKVVMLAALRMDEPGKSRAILQFYKLVAGFARGGYAALWEQLLRCSDASQAASLLNIALGEADDNAAE